MELCPFSLWPKLLVLQKRNIITLTKGHIFYFSNTVFVELTAFFFISRFA